MPTVRRLTRKVIKMVTKKYKYLRSPTAKRRRRGFYKEFKAFAIQILFVFTTLIVISQLLRLVVKLFSL